MHIRDHRRQVSRHGDPAARGTTGPEAADGSDFGRSGLVDAAISPGSDWFSDFFWFAVLFLQPASGLAADCFLLMSFSYLLSLTFTPSFKEDTCRPRLLSYGRPRSRRDSEQFLLALVTFERAPIGRPIKH